ncbi:MAG: helix-turn-helix domain-containing protein [Beijerinckiaceae bacterium]
MPIVVNLDVMLAKRKVRARDLAVAIGIAEQNVSLLRSGKVKGVRFDTLEKICAALDCQPGDLLEFRAEPFEPFALSASERDSGGDI